YVFITSNVLHSFPPRRSSDLKHAHRVHPDPLRPGQLTIDPRAIERSGLPHLELIDGARRDVIAANEPRLACVPFIRPCRSPALRSEEHTSELQSPDHLVCRLL